MAIGISKTFPMDLELISRLVQFYSEQPGANPESIGKATGLNKPKVDGLNALMSYLALHERRVLTDLGRTIFENDQYLKDFGTFCVLHYLLASNHRAEVWFFASNHFIPANEKFTREGFALALDNANIGGGNTRLPADRNLFLNAYSGNGQRALQSLRYVVKTTEKEDLFEVHTIEAVPPLILAFALYHQRSLGVQTNTISINTLLSLDGQIGKVFLLDRKLLLDKLRKLEVEGIIRISQIADLDNITFTSIDNPLSLLTQYYKGR